MSHANRIPTTVKKVSDAPAIVTPASMRHSFISQVEGATDTDIVQVHVTTKRQATTTDGFRLTPPNGPDEICVGWKGLAHFFVSVEIADSVCYLTAMRMFLYPTEPGKWTTRCKNFEILRVPQDGGERMPLKPVELLPPLPGHAEKLPSGERGNIARIPTPRELEALLTGMDKILTK
jgi:hypothetical protein